MAEAKISYRAKFETTCPVCDAQFYREELLTGGGRMNAGDLTDELHRIYLPTRKYGSVYPLNYPVSVCPCCWYAAYPMHFEKPGDQACMIFKETVGERKNMLRPIFPDLDFEQDRKLPEGVASYILAAVCCEHSPPENSPTFIRGLSFLRAGWLAMDLHRSYPGENYDYMSGIFLRKASFFYSQVLECERTGSEDMESIPHHGPDLDNNYGYDGVLYLVGVLLLKYGQRENAVRRKATLKQARAAVSRIVGMGESSRSKPSAILDLGRDLHKSIKKELEALEGEP